MGAAQITALIAGIGGIITAVSAAIAQIRHNNNPNAHK